MDQKYQNEISPIIYYGKKLKISGKLQKYLIYSPVTEDNLTEWPGMYVDVCPSLYINNYLRLLDASKCSG